MRRTYNVIVGAVSLLHSLFLARAFHEMSTIAPMWSTNNSKPVALSASFSVCVLQAVTLHPICFGSYPLFNNSVPPSNKPLLALSGGAHFTCGLDYGSRFPICWGELQVPAQFQAVSYAAISSGAYHACALRADESGSIDCWGTIQGGAPKLAFASVSSGWGFSCGLTPIGTVVCWGDLSKDILPPEDRTFESIYTGGNTVCGIMIGSRNVSCWGTDDSNQSVAPAGYRFSAVTGGLYHTCGLRADSHQAVCWGSNERGQLEAPRSVPFSTIAAGDYYTCGVRLDRFQKLLCWGNSVEYVEVNFSVAQAICGSYCGRDQYSFEPGNRQCPVLKEKVCLTCASCTGDNVELSPCAPGRDRGCGARKASEPRKLLFVFVLVPLAVVLFIGCLVMGLCIYVQCRRQKERKNVVKKLEMLVSRNENERVVPISAADLEMATGNYSEEMILGRGAFGTVYKGVLRDGKTVAIKRATSANRSGEVFDKELQLLCRTHHSCLVNLVGYCLEEKLLVFEFMSRGSLFQHISEPTSSLSWTTRVKIAAQAARGLEYLHKYACPTIIHRDVKTANILLDDDWNAHVADFGLSLFGPRGSATHLSNMTIVGTPGYLDPEYGLSMKLTTKSDVYSFGVVLLELLSGEKPIDPFRTVQSIVAWARQLTESDSMNGILDPALTLPAEPEHLYRAVMLALDCASVSSRERPSMTDAAKCLEEILEAMNGTASPTNTGMTNSVLPAATPEPR